MLSLDNSQSTGKDNVHVNSEELEGSYEEFYVSQRG